MINKKIIQVYKAYFSKTGLVKVVHLHLMTCHYAGLSEKCNLYVDNQYWACWLAEYFVKGD